MSSPAAANIDGNAHPTTTTTIATISAPTDQHNHHHTQQEQAQPQPQQAQGTTTSGHHHHKHTHSSSNKEQGSSKKHHGHSSHGAGGVTMISPPPPSSSSSSASSTAASSGTGTGTGAATEPLTSGKTTPSTSGTSQQQQQQQQHQHKHSHSGSATSTSSATGTVTPTPTGSTSPEPKHSGGKTSPHSSRSRSRSRSTSRSSSSSSSSSSRSRSGSSSSSRSSSGSYSSRSSSPSCSSSPCSSCSPLPSKMPVATVAASTFKQPAITRSASGTLLVHPLTATASSANLRAINPALLAGRIVHTAPASPPFHALAPGANRPSYSNLMMGAPVVYGVSGGSVSGGNVSGGSGVSTGSSARASSPWFQPILPSMSSPLLLSAAGMALPLWGNTDRTASPSVESGMCGELPVETTETPEVLSQPVMPSGVNDDEGLADYRPGGYGIVRLGQVFHERYKVLSKMGWGHYATVWEVLDLCTTQHLALKIVKSAENYTEAAKDEIQILQVITGNDPEGTSCCCRLYDSFTHVDQNGEHVCMVFILLGSNLLDLIKLYSYKGIPIPLVKHITRQILIGLDYMHTRCQIIHTDLKPENCLLVEKVDPAKHKFTDADLTVPRSPLVRPWSPNGTMPYMMHPPHPPAYHPNHLLPPSPHRSPLSSPSLSPTVPPDSPQAHLEDILKHFAVKIIDFGNANWVHKRFTDNIQTRQYRAPEVIIGAPWDTTVDMWSLGCMVFELCTGDLLFEPHAGDNFSKEDDHLAQMIELLGDIPSHMIKLATRGRDFFDDKGRLIYIPQSQLCYWPIDRVLKEKYHIETDEADMLASFILWMLSADPAHRKSARQCLSHPWLTIHPPRPSTPTQQPQPQQPSSPRVLTLVAPSPTPTPTPTATAAAPTPAPPNPESPASSSSPALTNNNTTTANNKPAPTIITIATSTPHSPSPHNVVTPVPTKHTTSSSPSSPSE
ncbi:SRSF protein kinase 1 [Pelomyxa schiedti]|nr:SRSF protein kinase 1 [Pelomyxa schiedti]